MAKITSYSNLTFKKAQQVDLAIENFIFTSDDVKIINLILYKQRSKNYNVLTLSLRNSL